MTITASKTTLQRGEEFKLTFAFAAGSDISTAAFKLDSDDIDRDAFEIKSGKITHPIDRDFAEGGEEDTSIAALKAAMDRTAGAEKMAVIFKEGRAGKHSGEMGYFTVKVKDNAKIGTYTITCTPAFKNGNSDVAATSNTITITISCEHTWGAWSNGGDNGHTRTCSKCQTPENEAHKWDKGKVTPATCVKDGATTYTCTVTGCGATKTDVISKDTVAHTYGAWTKDTDTQHKRTCTVSGCTAAETENHQWDNGEVTKPGTCAAAGEKTYKCTVSGCTATKIEPTDPSDDHVLGKYEKVSDTEHKRSCTVSGCNYTEKNSAHRWSEFTVKEAATCVKDGVKIATCLDGCGAEKTEKISKDTVAHTYGTWTKESDDKHKHTCTVSGCTASESVDHTWNNGAVTKTPTCKEDGVRTYTCTGCGAEKTEKIDKKTEHDWGKWTEVDATNHKRICNICGDTVSETKTHNFATKWSTNKDQHWYECADCGAKKDAANHTPGAAATETKAQRCTVCNYIIKPALGHTHKWATKYTTDAESHWYACSGCNEKKDAKAHDFANDCDPLCETCQYTRETTHKFGTEWSSDADSHFHACTSCGEKTDIAEHAPGMEATETTAQTCTACGYELAPALGHTHAFGEVWEKDDANHWHVCACGEKADEAEHDWGDGVICTICLAEKAVEEEAQKGSFPWLIILLAVLGVGAIVVIIVINKKKK